MDSLESTMNTTTSPQVGKGTLKDAGILEENEDDNDNARYRQSMPESMKTGGTGNIADVNSPCQLVCVCARGGGGVGTLGAQIVMLDIDRPCQSP